MHTLLDLRGSIPAFVHITDGKVHDVNILDILLPEPWALCIMDRAYLDFARLHILHLSGAHLGPAEPSAAEGEEAMNDPDVPQSASPEEEARIADTPAVFANKVYISPTPDGAKITLAEARRVSDEDRASPHAAVFLQHAGLAVCPSSSTGRRARPIHRLAAFTGPCANIQAGPVAGAGSGAHWPAPQSYLIQRCGLTILIGAVRRHHRGVRKVP